MKEDTAEYGFHGSTVTCHFKGNTLTDIEPKDAVIGMPVEMVIRKISEEGVKGVIIYGYKFRPVMQL